MSKIRVQEYGVCSYWPASLDQAMVMANQIMQRNGCGNIQIRQKDSTWALTHRFERYTGVVEANNHPRRVEVVKSLKSESDQTVAFFLASD